MNKKIKIGWVGSGFIGQVAHLSSFTTLDNIKITGLAELRENLRHDIQKKYQILNVFKNHKELLDYGDFDAVIAIVRRHHTATIAKDILNAPLMTKYDRLDETGAARNPILTYNDLLADNN